MIHSPTSKNGARKRIGAPMLTFDTGDIIKVPFPCTNRPVRERWPALVVASRSIQEHHGLLWVMMITSSENRGWPGDVVVSDLKVSGLPVASIVRTAKIATIEGKKVILSRAPTQPVDDPFANFDEWNSEADRRAYADL